MLWLVIRNMHRWERKTAENQAAATTVDPVCGMTVESRDAAGHTEFAGREYYFCSKPCLTKFEASPEAYAGHVPKDEKPKKGVRDSNSGRAAAYTCPMHPDVRQ